MTSITAAFLAISIALSGRSNLTTGQVLGALGIGVLLGVLIFGGISWYVWHRDR